MSFSLPKNVPSFTSSQRPYEDGYWGHSGQVHRQNGHTMNGMGDKLNGFLDKRELPMYKDKPYSYAASRRQRSLFKRKRVVFAAISVFLCLVYWFTSSSSKVPKGVKKNGASARSWMRKQSGATVDWDERRERVKDAFILSWDGYEQYAWGNDLYHPVSKTGEQMTNKGMGWIIVDALDTLMIMNLTSRLSHAREWISTSLDYDQDHEVNTFETTIRMLGGLLSAHYLSNAFPDMAPLTDDDQGAPGEDLYLEKATDLADRLLGAFDSNSGVPYASVNLRTGKGKVSHLDGGASSTSEAASLQLEFKYLAKLTGERNYWDKAEKVIQVIDDNGMEDGLLPIFIYADAGNFRGDNIRLGSRGDSYYEYLIKQYLQTSQQEPIYQEMWNQALAGVRKHLITYSKASHLTILAERPAGLSGNIFPKMDHLVCFMPGTIALGATGGLPEAEAKKSPTWGKQQEEEMALARELTKTCWGMYKVTATGLAPEIAHFKIDEPAHMESDGILASGPLDEAEDAEWRSDYVIKDLDSHNLQRPETVESLFYMWRITGEEMYREWGWEMFKAFVEYTEAGGGGLYQSGEGE
ncbi:MAG: glycoside hydrolase family 47 [Lasallia pustulata]|uniref:alpha-1,2-Mannosidase n=1 Tax=Lasallia pustulata TaxID=136370 RepID=A0A5M8Q5P9_9LECA|nr:MAG: glycoside hydrolase family 47 [Lasallia pustulata]